MVVPTCSCRSFRLFPVLSSSDFRVRCSEAMEATEELKASRAPSMRRSLESILDFSLHGLHVIRQHVISVISTKSTSLLYF